MRRHIAKLPDILSTEAAAAALLASVAVSIVLLVARPAGVWTSERWLALALGLAVSAVTAVFLKLLPASFVYIGRRREERRFLDFFGEVTKETRGAILTFSHRSLDKDPGWKTLPETQGLDLKGAIPEGLNCWLPLQDLRGANYVSGELAKMVRQTPFYRTDRDLLTDPLDQIRATVFSFGLGFNWFTHRIAVCTDRALFDVTFSPSPNGEFTTDGIALGGVPLIPHRGMDVAIVARVPHKRDQGAPTRYFFICAGRTASGTAVAGHFLAENWKALLGLYKGIGSGSDPKDLKEHALLVVLGHRYHTKDSEDDAGEILIGADEKPMIRWWSAAEAPLRLHWDDES